MPTIDYAIMNGIGSNGATIQKSFGRVRDATQYPLRADGLARNQPVHVLLMTYFLSERNLRSLDCVRQNLFVNVDAFSQKGIWKSMVPIGWFATVKGQNQAWYSSPDLRIGEKLPNDAVKATAKIARLYQEKEAGKRYLALVGFDGNNTQDPTENALVCETDYSMIINDAGVPKPRPAHRGTIELKPGTLVLRPESPDLTIEDFAEAPQRMGKEVVALFHNAMEGIFQPHLIYDELGIESKTVLPKK
ncbi:hypothetical protein HYU14_01865 [Candidatus Woesearchaeota archaeon]|nr:hypothetical protein [Candidatus Woesearchaeota archaeon]